jgi:hypothetical protein
MALRAAIDLAQRKKEYPLHGCFVDFSKAFDSVRWWAIRQVLESWRVPEKLISAIFNVMQGHTVTVRTSDGLLGDPIPVNVGVLQGDTLAPFLFILVVDGLLRKLPEEEGILLSAPKRKMSRRQMEIYKATEKRIPALAYADDLFLMSHTTEGLQKLFSTLEKHASEVGLLINMGKGKTERFHIDKNNDPGSLKNSQGEEVPVAANYKYLGVMILNFEEDMTARTAKAWGALKALDPVWKSEVQSDIKRSLFFSLIEPIFSYGLSGWSLTKSQLDRIDAKVSRMLRYAMGLPPAYLSRDTTHTEDLYGPHEFMSSHIIGRRIRMLFHHIRASTRNERHPYIEILTWDTEELANGKKRRRTLQQSILCDLAMQFPEQLLTVTSRTTANKLATAAMKRRQDQRWGDIKRRREKEAKRVNSPKPTKADTTRCVVT